MNLDKATLAALERAYQESKGFMDVALPYLPEQRAYLATLAALLAFADVPEEQRVQIAGTYDAVRRVFEAILAIAERYHAIAGTLVGDTDGASAESGEVPREQLE